MTSGRTVAPYARILIALCILATLAACQRSPDGRFVGTWKQGLLRSATPIGTSKDSSRGLELNLQPDHTFWLDVPTLDLGGPGSTRGHISSSTVRGTWRVAKGKLLFNTTSFAGTSIESVRQEEVDFETRLEESRQLAERLDAHTTRTSRAPQLASPGPLQSRRIYSFIDLQIPVAADLSTDDNRLTMTLKNPDASPIDLARARGVFVRN